jgi:pimeloyl-ACP methyl ester carboxylesterase
MFQIILLMPGHDWQNSEENDQYLLALMLDQNGDPVNNNIKAERVIRKTLDIYGKTGLFGTDSFAGLESWLTKKGYHEGEGGDFNFFPYDWRLDISVLAGALNAKIENVLKKTGAKKVTIIAHSMGGLVTKKYIIDNNENPKIKNFILLGTPNLGAPKILLPLVYGDTGSSDMDMYLDKNIIKEISRNFHSSYQLLPSYRYFQTIGSYFETDDPENTFPVDTY